MKGKLPENTYFNKEYKKFIFDTVSSKSFQCENLWKGDEIKCHLENKDVNLKNIFKFIQIFYIKKTFKDFSNS